MGPDSAIGGSGKARIMGTMGSSEVHQAPLAFRDD